MFPSSILEVKIFDEYTLVFLSSNQIYIVDTKSLDTHLIYDLPKNIARRDNKIFIEKYGDRIFVILETYVFIINLDTEYIEIVFHGVYTQFALPLKHSFVKINAQNLDFIPFDIYEKNDIAHGNSRLLALEITKKYVITGSIQGTLTVLQRQTQEMILTKSLGSQILCITLNEDTIFAGTSLGLISLDLTEKAQQTISEKAIFAISVTHNALIVGTVEGEIIIFNRNDLSEKHRLRAHNDVITDITTDNFYIFTASVDNSIAVIAKANWKLVKRLHHTSEVLGIKSTDDKLFTIHRKGHILSWSKDNFAINRIVSIGGVLSNIDIDSKYIYTCNLSGFVHILSQSLDILAKIKVDNGQLFDLKSHFDKIFVTSDTGTVFSIKKNPVVPSSQDLKENKFHHNGVIVDQNYYIVEAEDIEKLWQLDFQTLTYKPVMDWKGLGVPYNMTAWGKHYMFFKTDQCAFLIDMKTQNIIQYNEMPNNARVVSDYLVISKDGTSEIYDLLTDDLST